ncbi:MAG: DUF6320 domain-containing protein [Acholeplasmataceae bacterium]
MKHCQNCNTYFKDDKKTCVICGRTLIDKEYDSDVILPGYPEVEVLKSKFMVFVRMFFLIAITSSLIVGVINLITYKDFPYLWSLIVVGTFLFLGNLLSFVVLSSHNYTTKTLRQLFILSLLLIVIDYFTDYKGWALGYVIPLFSAATTLVLPIITAARPKKYYLHVRSLLLLVIINLIIIVLAFTTNLMIDNVIWPSLVSGFSGITLLFTMFLIAPKTTYHELVKIFHI